MKSDTERMRQWREKKKTDLNFIAKDRERRKAFYYKKKKEDPDFFNKKMKQWRDKKIKKDPKWNAERQREFRKKYPEKYHYIMARYYVKKLSQEKRIELFEEVKNG